MRLATILASATPTCMRWKARSREAVAALRRRHAPAGRTAPLRRPRSRARARRSARGERPERQRQVEPDPPSGRAASAPIVDSVERADLALAGKGDNIALDRELASAAAGTRLLGKLARPGDGSALGLSSELAAVPVRLLSSGQLKRATLARAASSGATLWLLDEPLNALDADGTSRLGTLVGQHRASGGAVLAASHQSLPGDWRRLELQS